METSVDQLVTVEEPVKVATSEAASVLDCRIYTPESLAALWGKPWTAASIREACRQRRIPSKKLGAKLWIIPAASLAVWVMEDLTAPIAPPGPRAKAAKPYRAEIKIRPST